MVNKFLNKNKIKAPSNRKLKVEESLKRAISDIINVDKSLSSFIGDISITISKVDISPDLRNAKIFIIPFCVDNFEDIIKDLNDNNGILKTYLVKKIELRYVPNLTFIYDSSFDNANKIENLINNINE